MQRRHRNLWIRTRREGGNDLFGDGGSKRSGQVFGILESVGFRRMCVHLVLLLVVGKQVEQVPPGGHSAGTS